MTDVSPIMHDCKICGLHRAQNGQWCRPCWREYERTSLADSGSIPDIIEWGAARAMKFDSARARLKLSRKEK